MICLITNRHLVADKVFEQVVLEAIEAGVDRVILREKDLSTEALTAYAMTFKEAMNKHQQLMVHSDIRAAQDAGADGIQFRFEDFMNLQAGELEALRNKSLELGVSVHALNEAILASKHGATYLLASHVFDTQCKAGTPGRGTDFIKEICLAVNTPVIGLGGISPRNLESVLQAGARGVAVMSAIMRASSPKAEVRALCDLI
jgi:thiamine-phosphate pyrophosphorylase